ncbi:MAG: hypothetical protein Q9201_006545 [Fulgogasparrea decipioides]
MSLSSSHPDIHALAERARGKFDEQMNAKDQRLPLILAHARLYDDLDHHLEIMRLKRKSSERSQHTRDTAIPNEKDAPRTEQTVPQDRNGQVTEKANGSWAKWDLVVDCAILEDEDGVDPSPKYDDVQRLGCSYDHSTSHRSHNVHADAAPQTTVSELPLDSDDESESESESDSDSDSDSESCPDDDFEFERTLSPEEKTATPASILRQISPHHHRHHYQWDSEPQPPPKSLNTSKPPTPSMQDPPQVDDDLSPLERSATPSQSSTSPAVRDTAADETDNIHTPQQTAASLKASPLSPQLCDSMDGCTDVSSAIYKDHRVQKALRQLLKPCRVNDGKEKLAYQQFILGTFSSLPSWGRRKGVESLGGESENEKIVS